MKRILKSDAESQQDGFIDISVKFKRLPHSEGLSTPAYKTDGAAGMDICSAVNARLQRHEWLIIPTGFAVEVPPGYEMQVRPRSGLAANKGLTILNSPGTIDEDYRGEIKVILGNFSNEPVGIERGDRIAQLVIAPVARFPVIEVDELSTTVRGERGLGSTGR